MKVVAVIPARYKSSRFPGKALIDLNGIPMIIRVCNIVSKAVGKSNTFVATDDERIMQLVESYQFKCVMTSEKCLTGTDRVYEFSKKINADIYINVQGDEPLLNPNDILKVIHEKQKYPKYVINAMSKINDINEALSNNVPKVLCNKNDELIYISRSLIPGFKGGKNPIYFKQVCIYAFDKNQLAVFGTFKKKSLCEYYEDIEILRFFDTQIKIKMVETKTFSLAVDIPEDVKKVVNELKKLEK